MSIDQTFWRPPKPTPPIRIGIPYVSSYVKSACPRFMRWKVWMLLILLLSFYATQPCESQAPNEAKFSVSGSVVNSVTGEPIRRALVQLQAMPARSSFTDGDGHFEIDGLIAGRFAISAQKPGYYDNPSAPRATSSIPVTAGPGSEPVVLKLSPYGVIYGRVINVDGEALEHIPVRLTSAMVRNGRKRWEEAGSRESDENGNFRFPNLQPGAYYLAAGPSADEAEALQFANGKGNSTGKAATGYPSVYYPNAPDLSSASTIVLAPGQQLQAEFSLPRVPVYKITGSVAGYAPEQGVGLQLTTTSGDVLATPLRFQQLTGTFEVDLVPPGSYVIKAFAQEQGRSLQGSVPVTVATNVNNVRLTLEPVVWIPITVRKESRNSPSASQESSSLRNRFSGIEIPVSVHLVPVGQFINTGNVYSTLRVTGNERLQVLDNVSPGRYEVEFLPQGNWYVQSADYEGTNLLTDEMTVRAGAISPPIQVLLRDDGASLEGTVSEGDKAGRGGTVVILPQRGSVRRPTFAGIYGEGNFRQDGLPPGEYLVFAAPNATGIEYDNSDALEPYLSQATHVTLSAGQSAKVTLNLVKAGETSQ